MAMIRSWLLVCLIMFIGMPVFAWFPILPLDKLVKSSEAILIAKVVTQECNTKPGSKVPETHTSLVVEKVLKGALKPKDPLKFTTPGGNGVIPEDCPVFPGPGERVLLFLEKGKDGNWNICNVIQGLWPLESGSDKTLGIGRRYSIKLVEAEIAK